MHPKEQVDLVVRTILAMPMAKTLKLTFQSADVGLVVLEMPIQPEFCFRPGQLQATGVFAIADFAAVSAAATTLPVGGSNATIDTSLKLVGSATGERLIARGWVIHVGRSMTTCAADVFALQGDSSQVRCATMLATAKNFYS